VFVEELGALAEATDDDDDDDKDNYEDADADRPLDALSACSARNTYTPSSARSILSACINIFLCLFS